MLKEATTVLRETPPKLSVKRAQGTDYRHHVFLKLLDLRSKSSHVPFKISFSFRALLSIDCVVYLCYAPGGHWHVPLPSERMIHEEEITD